MFLPSTPILDQFNRADEILSSGNWAFMNFAPLPLELVSNVVQSNHSVSGSSYWAASQFAGSQEAFVKLNTKWSVDGFGIALWTNLQTPGTSGIDGYLFTVGGSAGGDVSEIYRIDNGGLTQLGATVTGVTFSASDFFLARNQRGSLTFWQAPLGNWAAAKVLMTRADATYGTGYIGLSVDDDTFSVDNFGGGAIAEPRRTDARQAVNRAAFF